MKPPRFSPKKHMTALHRVTALRMLLVQTSRWPPDQESLIRSTGLAPGVVQAEIACEDMRRQMR